MTILRAIIFDVDGTLADTERDGHRIAFNQAFAEAGLDWNWSESLYGDLLSVAGGKERIAFYLQKYRPDFKAPQNLNELISQLHQAKTQHYRNLLASGSIPLRPGVKRLIDEAKSANIRLAIATTSALPNVLALLEQYIEPSVFEEIAAGDIVPCKKPAPDIYHYVLQKMDLQPSECLVIEDSEHGLAASTAARLNTIVTVNDYTKNQDFSKAILVLNHLGEPNYPCTVLKGNILPQGYLDISVLSTI